MQKPTDKIYLSTEDSEDLADAMAKLEPGDTLSFKGTASLDEDSGGVAVLSITEFNVVQSAEEAKAAKGKGKKSAEEAEESDEPTEEAMAEQGNDEPPAVQLAKRRSTGEMGA